MPTVQPTSKSRDTLRALAVHLETQREDERRAITKQVHEDLAQKLAVLRLYLSMLEKNSKDKGDTNLLAAARDIAEQCLVRSRDMVTMLRPAVLEMGVVPALRWLAEDFREGCGLKVDVHLAEDIRLGDECATFIFRAAQEALINVMRHAAATHVRITLDLVDQHCRLTVRDNGKGFDPEREIDDGAFGLIRIQQQADHLGGKMFLVSRPDLGTTLEIRIPREPSGPDLFGGDARPPSA